MIITSILSKLFDFIDKTPVFESRGCDPLGCGHFGAPRGSRKHKGYDVKTKPGQAFPCPFNGVVVKHGWVYKGDSRYRITDIKTDDGFLFRAYYVEPTVSVGKRVKVGQTIGVCQDITAKHGAKMINHAHLAIMIDGVYVDPKPYLRLKEA